MRENLRKLRLPPCTLGEGPLWHRETGEFVFTDIVKGTLFACTECGAVRELLRCRYQLGAFLFDARGDLLLLTEEGVFACPYGGGEPDFRRVWEMPMAEDERFNDAICDPEGRVIAGTKTERNTGGSLWLLEPGQKPRRLLENLKISNGMGFADGGNVFYHTDSGDRTIFKYSYDAATGSISNRRAVVTLSTPDGAVPDGMTVDAQGALWTACWGGGCVRRFGPDGAQRAEFSLPASQISSVAFGGAQLDRLLVTSASIGTDGGEEGGIWLLEPGARGVEEFRAAPV